MDGKCRGTHLRQMFTLRQNISNILTLCFHCICSSSETFLSGKTYFDCPIHFALRGFHCKNHLKRQNPNSNYQSATVHISAIVGYIIASPSSPLFHALMENKLLCQFVRLQPSQQWQRYKEEMTSTWCSEHA